MNAIEQALSILPTEGDLPTLVAAAKCKGLMIGYDARWKTNAWQSVSVEEVFHLPVVNPETGAASRSFTQAGRFDGIVEYNGRPYLLEHKTTSEDIADPNAPYWRRLTIDSQVSAYVLANWQAGRKLEGTLYDVIRKPGIRPKNISKAEQQQIILGNYCDQRVPQNIRLAVQAGQTSECPDLYAMRLAAECVAQPEKYFARRIVPRLDSEISDYATEMWEISKSILHARQRDAHYRNSEACMTYGTPCQFLGICSGHDSHDSQNWTRADNVHSELPILDENNGRDVLTNTRLKTFQTCRRKHYLRYELGIRKVDEEEKEALFFGRMMHSALEAFWSFYLKGKDNGDSSDVPASGVGTSDQQTELAW